MTGPAPAERPAGLARILAAGAYDGLLTLAILFLATALALITTGGEAIAPATPLYDLYLVVAGFPYFAWCWVRGGRTLGMRAWHLRLVRADGGAPTARHAVLRYTGALVSWAALGLGFAWILVDTERRSWHDRISGTRVVRDR